MAINKVVVGTEVKLDLTQDTVTADKLASGITAHDKTGAKITGTNTNDVDSTDGTAAVAEILYGKTAYARGTKLTGTMPNIGAVVGIISSLTEQFKIAMGFHDGSGGVSIAEAERKKIIAANIKSGITILGVTGSYGGEAVTAQSKSVTPSLTAQTILPDEGYDYISQVDVAAIPVKETENSAGGTTLTIGA